MLGRLSWAAIPFNVPVVMIAAGSVGFVIFCVLALVTVKAGGPICGVNGSRASITKESA
jgi:cytochrome o ubiquinol oxidase subunit 1